MKKLFCVIFSISLFFVITMSKLYADGTSLSIYPPVIEVQTTPPSSPTTPITISNNTQQDVNLTIELVPFKPNNINGQVIMDPEEINRGFNSYIKDRIQFLVDGKKASTISLKPLEIKEIILNINLAKGDPPGDYYYSIVFLEGGSGPSGSTVSQIPAGIATNLLLSIGPKDRSTGSISEFNTSAFKTGGPVDFTLKLNNSSSHLISPTGTVTIKNIFGQTVGIVDILPQYVLAGASRYLVDSTQASPSASLLPEEISNTPQIIWHETFLLGWYKATANVHLDGNGNSISSNVYFIAFPLYLFFPLVIVLFIILSVYLKVKKKI